jgi:hypothetical protein
MIDDQIRPIASTHNVYGASADGTIHRLRPEQGARLGPVKGTVATNGYRLIHLRYAGTSRNALAHRLVAEAFWGPIPKDHVVCHLNHDRLDNRIENLLVATQSENMRQSVRDKRPVGQGMKGVSSPNRKLSEEDYREIKALYSTGDWRQVDLAKRYGVRQTTISLIICNGRELDAA